MWVAQALEHNIAAFGPDIEHAKRAFERTLSGYLEIAAKYHREPLADLKPAPPVFWNIWNQLVERSVSAERMPSIPAFMIPVVTYDPLPA